MFGRLVVSFVNYIQEYRNRIIVHIVFFNGSLLLCLNRIWPGKSDVDQLYLIRKTLGNLIDKHITILKSNPHYKNVHMPEPDTIKPM